MKRFPNGITGGQIRAALEEQGLGAGDQTHLDRRKRDLKKWFEIEKSRVVQETHGIKRIVTLYKFIGERTSITDEGQVDQKLRAQVIHAAHARCQMCGQTVRDHGITLVVDHMKPRNWDGTNDIENLWAICEACNSGKKDFFSSLDADREMMKAVLAHESVHVRIGELLKAVGIGKRTPSYLLNVVANQDDWHKRLRELRYPVIGWDIQTAKYKGNSGRILVDYVLRAYKPWPKDPSGVIRLFEKNREQPNREGND
jgi:5-methylcytosine-specific restriction endonuclease McrA